MPTVPIRYEQAVYGSFPFWDRGYAVLAQSPGCRPEWLANLRAVCQRYGEPPRGTSPAGAFFALRLPSGPFAIVGVSTPGADDQGRPGALAFHALFLSGHEFGKVRFDPFALSELLEDHWGPETAALPSGAAAIPRPSVEVADGPPDAHWVVARLREGKRAVCECDEPIDRLARQVWERLPTWRRRRLSLATLAFGNGNRFDLLAVPRLAGVTLDSSYAVLSDATTLEHNVDERQGRARLVASLGGRWRRAGVMGLVLFLAMGTALAISRRWRTGPAASPTSGTQEQREAVPDRAGYREAIDADEQAIIVEGLIDLTEHCGLALPASPRAEHDPAALMIRLSQELQYRGPRLSKAEFSRLEREPGREARRALAWHNTILRFLGDRPLPADFASGPLRWQLDTLCWSFHVEPDPRLSAAEVPHHLAAALAFEGSLRPCPLADRYRALAAYAAFLERLPRG